MAKSKRETTESKPKPGRPQGAKSSPSAIVEVSPPVCPHCKQSTAREVIRVVREQAVGGKSPSGQPRTHIVWRRVQCRECHGYFVEIEHQCRPDKAA